MITRGTSFLIPLLIARLKIGYSFISKPAWSIRFYSVIIIIPYGHRHPCTKRPYCCFIGANNKIPSAWQKKKH